MTVSLYYYMCHGFTILSNCKRIILTRTQSFIKELSKDDISAHINERCDFFEGAPIHSIVRQSSSDSRTQRYRRCPSADCLIALLKYDKTDIEVNHWDSNGCTPLHIAVQVRKQSTCSFIIISIILLLGKLCSVCRSIAYIWS